MFEYVTSIITPEKNYPVNICCSCLEELLISYKFKRKCEENHQILKRSHLTKKSAPAVEPNNVSISAKSYDKVKINGKIVEKDIEEEQDPVKEKHDPAAGTETYSCNKFSCTAVFFSREELRDHTLELHLAEGLYRTCEICNETVAKRRFKQHLQLQHGIDDENLVCVDCFLMFPTQKELEIHQTEVHDINFSYRCRFCQLGFLTVTTLLTHVQKEHSGSPAFHCANCNFSAYSKYAIRVHVALHIKKPLYHCKTCDKAFKSAITLSNHEETHGSVKSFQCPKCFRMYKTSKALAAHKAVHNPSQRFECPVCAKIFSFGHNLRQHSRIVHPGFKLPPLNTLIRLDLP